MDTLGRAIARTYLLIALAGGGAMVFLSPPFQAPDEPNHFLRAQALSEGHLLARRESNLVGAPMSLAIPDWASALFDDIAGHPEKKQSLARLRAGRDRRRADAPIVFADFRNSALYSPVAYLPQTIGLALGRWLRLPLLDAFYLGRLLNLISAVALCYWAARRLPYGQLPFVMIALCPMFLFELGSFSADPLTYALAAAFCGAVLRASVGAGPLGRREMLTLSALGALMALTKPSSAPLPLVSLLLLRRPPGSSGRRPWREVIAVMGIAWSAMLGWSLVVSDLYIVANSAPGIDPSAQRVWILSHPLPFAAILWRSLRANLVPLLYSAVGVLGWLDTMLADRYIRGFYAVVLASGALAGRAPSAVDRGPRAVHPSRLERALMAALVISTYALIGAISYLTWTPVAAPLVEGLQGRYFLPLIVAWAVLLQWPRWAQDAIGPRARAAIAIGCLGFAVLFLGHAFRMMYLRFWA